MILTCTICDYTHYAPDPTKKAPSCPRCGPGISLVAKTPLDVEAPLAGSQGPSAPLPSSYAQLHGVLMRAIDQAANGKGKERHAFADEQFSEQQIVKIGLWLGSPGFEIGQAVKKAIESARLPKEAAIAELLGAINYLAAAVIVRGKLP